MEENIRFSDHGLVVTDLNFEIGVSRRKNDEVRNLHTTSVPCYNLKDADWEDWTRFRCILSDLETSKEERDVVRRIDNLCEV